MELNPEAIRQQQDRLPTNQEASSELAGEKVFKHY